MVKGGREDAPVFSIATIWPQSEALNMLGGSAMTRSVEATMLPQAPGWYLLGV